MTPKSHAKQTNGASAREATRIREFKEILEEPPSYTPSEIINLAFDDSRELTFEERELISSKAKILVNTKHDELAEIASGAVLKVLKLRGAFAHLLRSIYHRDAEWKKTIEDAVIVFRLQDEMVELLKHELRDRVLLASKRGKKSAEDRHSRPGGAREKQNKIRQEWATGKYSTRNVCAEENYDSLDMSYESARKALRNTPDPLPRP